jgi:hypothetical protein
MCSNKEPQKVQCFEAVPSNFIAKNLRKDRRRRQQILFTHQQLFGNSFLNTPFFFYLNPFLLLLSASALEAIAF